MTKTDYDQLGEEVITEYEEFIAKQPEDYQS